MRCPHQRLVEVQALGRRAALGLVRLLDRRPQLRQVLRGGAFGRQPRGRGLQRQPGLGQLLEGHALHLQVRAQALGQQRQVRPRDVRTSLAAHPHLDQAGRLQRAQGVPHGDPADPELQRLLALGRQPVARLVAAGEDRLADLLDHVGGGPRRSDAAELGLSHGV